MSENAFSEEAIGSRVITGLSKISLALKAQAWKGANQQGLTPTQGQILALLGHKGSRRLGEIAELLGITPATTSEAVKALIAKGLVVKNRGVGDARSVSLNLTPDGRAEAERTALWPDFLLAALESLEPEEQRIFLRSLVKMIRSLQEMGHIAPAQMCVTCTFFRPHAHPDPARPHHCAFVDAAFGDGGLRLECADHQPAPREQAHAAWSSWSKP
ncbi:MarR family winged helix-turn-helix transcriptional regulator [Calidithermus roseus]|uniref:Putative HTH-type transcriptional regulator YusO n=1 Tax=Calidithermus roseus TaxID=1644118 RepID=A0A399EVC7_9DEIN|nr:MarR family winged helix-turn-helix transcriptional regulator [Calidithermus roseus]RIH87998.1 putative HTH-type transcriptional regulator YusO [Calidithermus roseus]